MIPIAPPDPRKVVIDRYADGGLLLPQASSKLTPEQAQAHPGPGVWSIAEVVAHLVDTDLVLAARIKRVIAEDEPPLAPFDETRWVDRLGSGSMPIGEAAALFEANRRWIARILRNQDETAFARGGVHPELGRLTLAALVVRATVHLDHHLRFLYAKRANLGIAIYPRYGANPGH